MGFIDQLKDWLGLDSTASNQPKTNSDIREAIEMAKIAQRAEDYDRALFALDQAMHVADDEKDTASVTIIALHQADVLTLKGQFDEAEQLLQTVQQAADAVNQPGFTSYALSSLGVLYQRQGKWDDARETFEQARQVAEQAESDGAKGRALGHLADVYLHENNASYAVHLLQDSLPMLNAAGDLELSSYFVGRLGEAMIATGQDTEGYQLLDRALKLGEQMRNKRMIRRWSVVIGNAAYDQQRYPEAYTFFKRALPMFNAEPTADYIDTLVRISRTCLNLGEREESLVYARQALQVSQQGTDDALIATAEGALGTTLRANGENEEAIEHLQRAVDGSQTTDGATVNLLRQLAAAQSAANQTEAAKATYERALEAAKEISTELSQAETYRDLGLFYASERQLTEAIQAWTTALDIFEEQNDHNQIARLHCDIASARRQLGQGQRAIREYEQALIALNNVDDIATRGLVLSNAANAYADQGDIESASAFFKESIDIARKIGDRGAQTTRQGNYGWFLLNTGKPRQAIEQLTEALEISNNLDMTLQRAVQTDNMGLAYDVLSQYKTAMEQHEKAQSILNELPHPPVRWQAMFKANAAKTKLSLGLVEDASQLFDQALEIARAAGDFEVLAGVLIGKSRALISQTKLDEAQPVVTEAIQIARQADLRRVAAEAFAVYSEQQAALNNDDRARELWEEAKRLYRMVGAPQAKQTPFWLGNNPPKTEDKQ